MFCLSVYIPLCLFCICLYTCILTLYVYLGDDTQTQAVVDSPGAMQAFPRLLTHQKSSIKKEAAWAVSNVTAGNQVSDTLPVLIHWS